MLTAEDFGGSLYLTHPNLASGKNVTLADDIASLLT